MKRISCSFFVTTACDRACEICMWDCRMANRHDFTVEMAKKLGKEISALDSPKTEEITITLTGGEPLMNPCLPEILQALYENLGDSLTKTEFNLISSGFLPGNRDERERMIKIFCIPHLYKKIFWCLSFHQGFSSRFEERLGATIDLFVQAELPIRFAVRPCLPAKNTMQTIRTLTQILREKGFDEQFDEVWPWPDERIEEDSSNIEDQVKLFLDDDRNTRMYDVKAMQKIATLRFPRQLVRQKRPGKKSLLFCTIIPIPLAPLGRAEKLPPILCWDHGSTPLPYGNVHEFGVNVTANGILKPLMDDHCQIKLGTLDDGLKAFAKRSELFHQLVPGMILKNLASGKVCDLCQKAAETILPQYAKQNVI